MSEADWPACVSIYQAGIDTGNATFDPAPSDWATFSDRTVASCNLVAVIDDESTKSELVVGCTWGLPVSQREILRGVVEESIYIDPDFARQGVGRTLMDALIVSSESDGIWTLQAGIFPENEASVAIHEMYGFRTVGVRERYALMKFGPFEGQWRDVVLMERRSKVVGQ
ncbi:MAG: N-acetyltransferase family protein [Candidatus Nanopelagicales bacterium]